MLKKNNVDILFYFYFLRPRDSGKSLFLYKIIQKLINRHLLKIVRSNIRNRKNR